LVASPIVDGDRSARILFDDLTGATESLVLGAETLGIDPYVEMWVTSCYRCRIPIENSIRHQFTPWLLEEKIVLWNARRRL
jgi:hypothetical protein